MVNALEFHECNHIGRIYRHCADDVIFCGSLMDVMMAAVSLISGIQTF